MLSKLWVDIKGMAKKRKNRKKTASPPDSRSFEEKPFLTNRVIMLLLFALAFVLRLVYLRQISHSLSFNAPLMDSLYYIKEAKSIAAGNIIGNKVFFMGPLYPYFLAFLIKVIGFDWFYLRFCQIIVGSLSVLLIYRLGYRASGKRPVGLGAGIISAGYGTFIYYDANLLMAFFANFLNLLLLNLLIDFPDYPGKKRVFGAGLLLGLCALARANILLLAPAVLLLWRINDKTLFFNRMVLPFLLGIVCVIGPVTLRNYLIEPEPVLITSNGGLNLYIGNNKDSKGIYIPLRNLRLPEQKSFYDRGREMDIEAREIAERAVGHRLGSAGTSRFWLRQAITFIGDNPGFFLKNLAVKAALFLNGTEIPQIEDIYFNQRYSPLLSIPGFSAGLIIPLGLLGMIICFPDRRKYGLLYFYALAYMLSIILFFITARYRVPVMPVFMLFASAALVESWEKYRQGQFPPLIRKGVALSALIVFCNWPLVRLDFAEDYYNFGAIYYQKGEQVQAIDSFKRSLKIRPTYTDAYRGLGIIYRLNRQYREAVGQFENILRYKPDNAEAVFQIGATYRAWEKPRKALEYYRKAVSLDPGHAQALADIGSIYYSGNNLNEAERYYRLSIGTGNYSPDATYFLGTLKMRKNEFAEAVKLFLNFQKNSPGKVDKYLYYNLGNSYSQLKSWKKAEAAYKKSLKLDPQYSDAYNRLEALRKLNRPD
ncbi:MAG: tetratricopeptide repeat protein [bacterium]